MSRFLNGYFRNSGYIAISVKVEKTVQKVDCVPEQKVKFTRHGERIEFVAPELNGHQMIALEYRRNRSDSSIKAYTI